MRRQSQVTLNVEAFDRRARQLGLTKIGAGGRREVNNSAIARHLGVAQSTISRARAGDTVGSELIAATLLKFDRGYHILFITREPVGA